MSTFQDHNHGINQGFGVFNAPCARRASIMEVPPSHPKDALHLKFLNFLQKNVGACTLLYVGVSKSFETSSIERQPMAVRECVRCAWEQGTSPLSMPSGVAV